MDGRCGGFDAETQWRVDLQSVLQETNLLSISAGDTGATVVGGASCKKYKKKKDLDDRLLWLKSSNRSKMNFCYRKRQEENRATQSHSVYDSDDEKLAQKRSQKRRKSKKMMVVEVERIQRHLFGIQHRTYLVTCEICYAFIIFILYVSQLSQNLNHTTRTRRWAWIRILTQVGNDAIVLKFFSF